MTHILDRSIFQYTDGDFYQIYNLISDGANDTAQYQAYQIAQEIYRPFHSSRHADIVSAIYYNLKNKSPNRERHIRNISALGKKCDRHRQDLMRCFNLEIDNFPNIMGVELALYFQR